MKRTDTIISATKSLNNYQFDRINSGIDFSQRQITTNTKPEQKKLTARWLLDENSKLFCQWVFEN
ncbi:MAG: hypothetical protein ACRCZS_03530 [Chroococcidiopsis sp.]